jgi:hypothetical protein
VGLYLTCRKPEWLLTDLGVTGQSDPITGRQLHELGIVFSLEPFTEGVGEDAAFAACRFRDERAGGILRLKNA